MDSKEYKANMEQRRKATAEGRERKKIYNRIKQETMKHEGDNYTKLYVVNAGDGWHKMFGHSAIIYAHVIAPRLGKKVTINVDTDFHFVSDEGVVSVKDFEELKGALLKLGLNLVNDDERIAVFHLGFRVEPEAINGYIKIDEMARKRVEALLMPEEVFPKLKTELQQLSHTTWFAVQKMREPERSELGIEMVRPIIQIHKEFYLMAKGWRDVDLFFSESQRKLEDAKCELAIIEYLRILDAKKIFRILSQIVTVEKELIKASGQLKEERERKAAEKKAEEEGKKLAKQSETKTKVTEKVKNGTKKSK